MNRIHLGLGLTFKRYTSRMERIVHKARSFEEAWKWEIAQYREMTPEQRQAVAKTLRDRFYGTDCPDVREAHGR